MSNAVNRALQVRAADRMRAALGRDVATGLPAIEDLSEADQRELCDIGGGRLAAVAIRLHGPAQVDVARLLEEHVRRTDLLGTLGGNLLLLLAPGLDPVGGRSLADRLHVLLIESDVTVSVGAAYRSAASSTGWTTRALAAEAELHPTNGIVSAA
jgi:hypothetical protein